MLDLHHQTRSGTGGFGVLPDPGGVNQQAAIVMDALAYIRSLQPPVILPVMLCSLPEGSE